MSIDLLRSNASIEGAPKIDILAELRRLVMKPGIYFGLPAEHYHADPSVGSSNLRAMNRGMRIYQADSWMTPPEQRRVRKETEATVVGTALHSIVLDGVEGFTRTYVRRSAEYENLSQGEKAAMTKAIKAALKPGQVMLDFNDYKLCVDAAQLIAEHDDLRNSLMNGFSEVSVFWVDAATGVPCKARYDLLKVGGIGDIKTIANMFKERLERAALSDIQRRRYDLQAAHYIDGRYALKKIIEDQAIFHISAALAEEIKARNDLCNQIRKSSGFAFQFIFLDKSEADVWSGSYSPENPIMRQAAEDRRMLLSKYRKLVEMHGTARWPHEWRLGEIHPEDMPFGDRGWR